MLSTRSLKLKQLWQNPEYKEKMRKSHLGYKMPETDKKKISKKMKGRKLSEKTKKKLGISKLGKNNPMFGKTGNDSPVWKGDQAGIKPKHKWVYYYKGKPVKCEHCNATSKEKLIEWANVDHKYKRNLDDYISLCRSCHRKYDIKYNNYQSKVSCLA